MGSLDGADVTVPLSTGEWLLSFWSAHLQVGDMHSISNGSDGSFWIHHHHTHHTRSIFVVILMQARKCLDHKLRPLEAIVEEGEVIFVPHGNRILILTLQLPLSRFNHSLTVNVSPLSKLPRHIIPSLIIHPINHHTIYISYPILSRLLAYGG